jgi:peptide-methionine (S)-S-oxide reductase
MMTRRKLFRSGVALSLLITLSAVFAAGITLGVGRASAEEGIAIPAPHLDEKPSAVKTETAIFAGGCFWGVQGVFQHVKGVTEAVSGYTGGAKKDAIYEVVGSGETGHAESVKVTYDPSKVTYGHLLQVYFSVAHDPTELNYQGPDTGTQYRSTVFAANEEQVAIAKAYITELNQAKVFSQPIVTTIETGKTFYPAEGYHQNFLELNPAYPYIVMNDLPKIDNLKRLFPKDYRDKPVLVKLSESN